MLEKIFLFGILAYATIGVHSAPTSDGEEYIIGGRPSEKGRWPWVVSLVRWRPEEGVFRHTCGAALITPNWILTAAHCVQYNITDYKVLVGAYNVIEGESDEEQEVLMQRIIVHEEYDGDVDGIPNDIAVVELAEPVDISNPNIGLAKLPRRDEDYNGTEHCWVAGWGRHNPAPDNWTSSPILLEVNTAIHSLEECREIWYEFLNGTEAPILDQHICIGLPDKGACHGDSGSPANVDVTGNGDWYIVGLNSWGTGDRCAAATNAFVRITYFLDWIYTHVSGLPGDKPYQPPEE